VASALRLKIAENGADPERLDVLTALLRDDLLQLDVDAVAVERAEAVPPGARAVEPVAAAGLLVAFGQAADSLRGVIAVVRQWLGRGRGAARTVRLEIGGDVLQLSNATQADQDRLVELFVRRHSNAGADR
jgi:hypothetical protein